MKLYVLIATILCFQAQATLKSLSSEKAPFQLPELTYATDSLKTYIDEETMKIHHGKHHKAYVDNLNKALGDEKRDLGAILKNIKRYPDAVRNNAGGHWNHAFFWTLLTPIKENQTLPETLNKKITEQFGSLDDFKKKFEQAGLSQFGAGWVWLIVNRRGKLEITTTPNQDNPLMPVANVKGTPILGIDVWEHAYYLKYQNQRGSYLNQIWNVINWKQVNEYYEEAIKL